MAALTATLRNQNTRVVTAQPAPKYDKPWMEEVGRNFSSMAGSKKQTSWKVGCLVGFMRRAFVRLEVLLIKFHDT